MPLVDIICLANSYKRGGRCVAGIRADGGGWVRPVASDTSDGQLYFRQYRLPDGSEPQLLDVVAVDLAEPNPAPGQPENWLIGKTPWVLRHRPAPAELEPLLEAAVDRSDLLLGSEHSSIEEAQVDAARPSLALITPSVTLWALGQPGEYRIQEEAHPRVRLGIGGMVYNLPVTDPHWCAVIPRKLAGKGSGWHDNRAAGIPDGAKVWMTVSLSEPYNGRCYKLAAGIMPRLPRA